MSFVVSPVVFRQPTVVLRVLDQRKDQQKNKGALKCGAVQIGENNGNITKTCVYSWEGEWVWGKVEPIRARTTLF